MPYRLDINHNDKRIELHYSGEAGLEDRKKARDEVFDLCHEHNISRVLVEMQDSDIVLTEKDIINFVTSYEKERIPSGYRVAGVISVDDRTSHLLESLISLEGINVRFFLDRDSATRWLMAC